jgi:tetratricopeptide (TPR) repeat protein
MQNKNKYTAAFLSFLTGWIGGHKLYLGDTGGFIFFMIMFFSVMLTTGFPITFLLSLFEGFKILNMSQQEFDRKYNGGYVQRADPRIERRRIEQMRRYEVEDSGRGYNQMPVNRQPHRVRANPFKSSGLAKYKEFDLDGAISDFQKGLEIDPNDVALNFNIACAYSLSEKKDEAYTHLAKAVSLGFNDFERILTHDDLAFVRIQPEFDMFKKSGYIAYNLSKKEGAQQNLDVAVKVENNDTLLAQLNRLAELKEKGILSEEEFVMEKKKLTRN